MLLNDVFTIVLFDEDVSDCETLDLWRGLLLDGLRFRRGERRDA